MLLRGARTGYGAHTRTESGARIAVKIPTSHVFKAKRGGKQKASAVWWATLVRPSEAEKTPSSADLYPLHHNKKN